MKLTSRTWAAVAALALTLSTTPAAAQVTASLAAVAGMASATTLEKQAGCWGCVYPSTGGVCVGGFVPGYWNCTQIMTDSCSTSSPGCGAGASLPLDPDGASQYVSRGQVLGIDVALTSEVPEFRNCEGTIVARRQAPDQIAAVRDRTATLTL